MAKKKKKQRMTPKKIDRMNQAKQWLPTYPGGRLIKAYRKKYRIGVACAARELHELGYIDAKHMEQVLKDEEGRIARKHHLKQEKAQAEDPLFGFQNDEFAYIAGYTSGGVAYGLRWDEIPNDELALFGYEKDYSDDDLPF
jgi:hypothetical protein